MAPPDAILGLNDAFRGDPNPDKMNLSVGVYKDASGATPILASVKAAERRLLETESTKGYLAIEGDAEFAGLVQQLLFAGDASGGTAVTLQAPGGTGALRAAADFLAAQLRGRRVWMSDPTWANHAAIFAAAGLETATYRYLAADKTTLDAAAMLDDMTTRCRPGDIVLLHACCHNPTGVDPSAEDWASIAEVLGSRGLIPLIDFAYQGFGDGLEADAGGLRTVLRRCEELIVCHSFSKNFGLYSERVGGVTLVARTAAAAAASLSQLKRVVRCNYSNPPRHGGSLVTTILRDAELSAVWRQELTDMRDRITRLRKQFVAGMAETGVDRDFSFLLRQRGMFSYSGLNPLQVDLLRSRHSIYVVGSGRINVAGMSEDRMPRLCAAVAEVLRET